MPLNVAKRWVLQDKTTNAAVDKITDSNDVYIVAPTGVGKNNMSLSIINQLQPGDPEVYKTLFVQERVPVHREHRLR